MLKKVLLSLELKGKLVKIKITKSVLETLIKEELENILKERDPDVAVGEPTNVSGLVTGAVIGAGAGPMGILLQTFKPKLYIISKTKTLPLHIRAFANYLLGRGTPFTEQYLSEKEKKDLVDLLLWFQWNNLRFARAVQRDPKMAIKKYGSTRPYRGKHMPAEEAAELILKDDAANVFQVASYGSYPRFKGLASTMDREEDSGTDINVQAGLPMLGGNFAEQVERFLGRTTIKFDRGKSLTVVDSYDFKQLEGSEHIEDLGDALLNFADWYSIVPSRLYIKIREMAPYQGKPFPINISLKL